MRLWARMASKCHNIDSKRIEICGFELTASKTLRNINPWAYMASDQMENTRLCANMASKTSVRRGFGHQSF